MRLLKIKIDNRDGSGGLRYVDHTFSEHYENIANEPICLVGSNGSGKSQLLQAVAEIFYYLDDYAAIGSGQSPYEEFEIEYFLHYGRQKPRHIKIVKDKKSSSPRFGEFLSEEITQLDDAEFRSVIPPYIVGYTSGENETISFPFRTSEESTLEFWRGAISPGEHQTAHQSRLRFLDYNTNISILISNCLMRQNESKSKRLLSTVGIQDLFSFTIVIQRNPSGKKDGGLIFPDEVEETINKLKKCATTTSHDEKSDSETLFFIVSDATKDAFGFHFQSTWSLYGELHQIELLNWLAIPRNVRRELWKKRKMTQFALGAPAVANEDKIFRYEFVNLKPKKGEGEFSYLSLSDGEHQFIQVMGSLLMLSDQENALVLLDEPESHFNPEWRIEFISEVNRICSGHMGRFVLTTHSPFMLSDLHQENVHIFKNQNGKISAQRPSAETYGSNFDYLLKDAFGVEPPIASKSKKDLNRLQKSDNLDQLKSRVCDFGDSTERFYVLKRIRELEGRDH